VDSSETSSADGDRRLRSVSWQAACGLFRPSPPPALGFPSSQQMFRNERLASSGGGAFGQDPRSPLVIRPAGASTHRLEAAAPAAEDVLDERHAPALHASATERSGTNSGSVSRRRLRLRNDVCVQQPCDLVPRARGARSPARRGRSCACSRVRYRLGRASYPRDDRRGFMESSHPPIPFDQ